MTAREPRDPVTGLNAGGNGRGLGIVTRPFEKKRGKAKDRTEIIPIVRKAINTANKAGAALVSPDKPLTEKQRAFVKFWAQGESISSASVRAGYGDDAAYAYRMVRMPNILKLYNEEKAAYEEAAQMTRKKVMDGLLEGIEMAKMVSDPSSVIRGWREVGLLCGYYEPVKVRLSTAAGDALIDRMERMSDAELLRAIQDGSVQQLPNAMNAALGAPE